MGFRFFRRTKLLPGVTLNLSRSGPSFSFGPRGAKFTIGARGTRKTVGLPGTGLFYTTSSRFGAQGAAPDDEETYDLLDDRPDAAPRVPARQRLTLGFFQRLFTPDDEKAFVDGCQELALGDKAKARKHLESITHMADAAYLAGFLALQEERLDRAETWLERAAQNHRKLGKHFKKYGIGSSMHFAVTPEVTAHVAPDLRGVLVALAEVYQHRKQREKAVDCLERLRKLLPEDVVVRLSLAELLLDARGLDRKLLRRVMKICGEVTNDTPVHAALMLYKGRALRRLGLYTAARDTLTAAFRRKKGRGKGLLLAIQYERALAYEALGKRKRAREEFEKIYAASPEFEDAGVRLGMQASSDQHA